MPRLIVTALGDPREVVSAEEVRLERPGPQEVVVEMEAATINDSDFLLIQGKYPVHPDLPSPVGAEGVGRVVAAGSPKDRPLIGSRVMILPNYEQGTWADRVLVARRNVVVVDGEADPLQLAMTPINPATAAVLLRRFATLRPGDWVGQTAANSAVGQYVAALAKRDGLQTLNIVRRESAVQIVLDAGGDKVVVSGQDLPDQISKALAGAELSLVLDQLGGSTVTELAHFLKFGGCAVSYAFLTGKPPTVDILDLLFKEVRLTGFWLTNWVRQAPLQEVVGTYHELAGLVASGELSTPVEATYPLSDYREAFAHAMRRQKGGKILFTFDQR
jgi:NADPH:quinone reductase-like Zn-dependent oxidoreductase